MNNLEVRVLNLEERLAMLEEDITRVGDRLSDHIDQDKPVTEENCNCSDAEEPHIHHIPNDDKPSEFISCSCCGGKQVYIRGKHPKDDNRLVCPTCAVERLEQIDDCRP